jgi:hypothetical protein
VWCGAFSQEKALDSDTDVLETAAQTLDVLETAAQTLEELCEDRFPIFGRCEFASLLAGDGGGRTGMRFTLVSSLKKVSSYQTSGHHDMGNWNIWPGRLDIVVRARDSLGEHQALTIPEEAASSGATRRPWCLSCRTASPGS